jgi:hypothetical protein
MAEEETFQIESPPIIPNNLPFSVSSNTPSAQEPVVYDLVSDPRQGLGVPAKGLYVRNRGTSGTLNVTILSGDGGERSFALQYSEEIGFDQDDGIHVWSVILSGSIDFIPYDLMAIPGKWTPEELWGVYQILTGEAVS